MASVTEVERPPVVLTIVLLLAVVVVGFLVAQWFLGFVFGLFRLAVLLFALYLAARLGWYLLRKGGAPRAG